MIRTTIVIAAALMAMGAAPHPAAKSASLVQSRADYITREECYRAHGCLYDVYSGTWLCPTQEAWICEYYPPQG